MKTKKDVGNTVYNDGLLLPNGMLSIDSEKKAVRFHDGQTVGGYEVLGTRAVPLNVGPGPEILVAGDMTYGFFGEVTSAELLTYEALATQIGLSAGISQFNAESLWLKFALDGNILFIAKKPARHSISWNNINAANAVFGGTTTTVGTHTLKVRLLKGAATDPAANATDFDIATSHGSEWNKLLYPIHSGVHTHASNPSTHTDPTAAAFAAWASYSDADLLVHNSFGTGSYCWCQEAHPGATNGRVHRGALAFRA